MHLSWSLQCSCVCQGCLWGNLYGHPLENWLCSGMLRDTKSYSTVSVICKQWTVFAKGKNMWAMEHLISFSCLDSLRQGSCFWGILSFFFFFLLRLLFLLMLLICIRVSFPVYSSSLCPSVFTSILFLIILQKFSLFSIYFLLPRTSNSVLEWTLPSLPVPHI